MAGIVDLRGERQPDRAIVRRMTDALAHRGPDEDGYLFADGIGIGQRRLNIVDPADGRQPIWNESRTVAVLFNGELFDYPEQRAALEARGHVFRTRTDTEIIVHLYEEHGEDLFEHLKGQFAFALFDQDKRTVILARDRFGICPLHWSRQGDTVYFGSEITALLASGAVAAECDPHGLDHVLSFMGLGARRTMFKGVEAIPPGHYIRIVPGAARRPGTLVERRYWDFDFPDEGDEDHGASPEALEREFEERFHRAVEIRLRADVPVVGYLSGGVDSGTVLAAAAKIRGSAPPAFTIRIPGPKLDETEGALATARRIGARPTIVTCGADLITDAYPKLVTAANAPVVDTSCAALWCLSREVQNQGYKVALTGEGADEALGGYPWFKVDALRRVLNLGPVRIGDALIGRLKRRIPSQGMREHVGRLDTMLGGFDAYGSFYDLVSAGARRFYSAGLKEQLGTRLPSEDFAFDTARMRRWHPLNRMLYAGYKIHLAGLLLNAKGDRVAMANSVETRYPFLDEDVVSFLARVPPHLKLKGIRRDKHLLRRMAARYLPSEIAERPKNMFRAPLAATFFSAPPDYVRELLSPASLAKTGYFDAAAVGRMLEDFARGKAKGRLFSQLGLVGVVSTQLWHHLHLGGGLCNLPNVEPQFEVERPAAA